jgi:hypothetical protein
MYTSLIVFSSLLVVTGEWQAAGALWVAVICLQPAMWVALGTSYFSLKLFCATTLITQIITVPMFYLQSDRYAFGDHRPFGFSPLDVVPVFALLGLFLWMLASTIKLSETRLGRPKDLEFLRNLDISRKCLNNLNCSNHNIQKYCSITIIFLIVISLPVKLWMYEMAIGIVGVAPPRLPFKLSGLLTYLFGMVIPLVIGYLYIKTGRKSLFLVGLVSVYSLMIGIASASKSVALYSMISIIAFSWIDRRWGIFTFSVLMTGLNVSLAAASREITHVSDGLTTGASTALGGIGTILETINQVEWSWELLLIFVGIAGRIEGFQGLWLASQFNTSAVGGSLGMFLNSISHGWSVLDHDSMHVEYLGYTIPYGFYGVAASLNAWMIMGSNSNLLMLIPFVIYASATLIILEMMLMRVAFKYGIAKPIAQSMLFFSTLWFYTGPGTLEFLAIFITIAALGYLPRIRVFHNKYQKPI